ncbi:MAG: aminopeptidase P family protein [Rectinema sp.]|jgi:Xaa-Pro aminopeptidase
MQNRILAFSNLLQIDHYLGNSYNIRMFTREIYIKRKEAFIRALCERGITRGTFILLANSESPRNYPSNCYPFRQDSSWLYFVGTGFPDFGYSLDIETGRTCLYADEPSLDDIIWTGELPSSKELAYKAGIDYSSPFSALHSLVADRLAKQEPLFILPSYRSEQADKLAELFSQGDSARRDLLRQFVDPRVILALVGVREIKGPEEIAEIERAVAITKAIHEDLLHSLEPGWTEKAAADYVLSRASAQGCELSFATIATCRGAVLHNSPTGYAATAQDTFLLDAGVEMPSGYAGDLTTTFPVGPRLGTQARAIYEVLYQAFETTARALAPGVRFIDIHKTASLAIAKGLISLGLMRGDPHEAVEAGAHALFFPHGLGHQIGLDVHDMEGLGEDYVGYGEELRRSDQFGLRSLRLAKTLKPGMVHSVEPGIYFIPQLVQKWRAENICKDFLKYDIIEKWMSVGGMRIEEDWCITESGARRLGPAFDKKAEALEKARSGI